MRTEEMTEQELDQLTQPAAESAFPEDPILDDLDLSDEIDPEVDTTEQKLEASQTEEVKPDPLALIAKLQAELDALKKAPKNQVAGTPGNRSYTRIAAVLNTEGKIPQQQADLAKILTKRMPIGEKFTEAQVFAFLNEDKPEFPSLVNSRQDVTYLFRYYRGLKPSGKHAGFVARKFLVQS